MEVDVEMLEREEAKKHEKPAPEKKSKPFVMNPIRSELMPQQNNNNITQPTIPLDREVKVGVKTGILKVMSLPFKEPKKRESMHNKLKKSDFVNKYIDNNIYVDFLNKFNDNAKFACIYGYHYLDTYLESDLNTSIDS